MQAPRQKCGTDHWLNQPCPRGECAQLGVTVADEVAAKEVVKSLRSRSKNAEKQHRWRERKKLSDPDFQRRENARMKAHRAKN